MDKNIFNKLSLVEQVNYFNCNLENGFKIIQVCDDINISYNTIRSRFVNAGYTYNKYTRQYECIEKIFPFDEKAIEKVLQDIVINIFNKDNINCKNTLNISSRQQSKIINRSFRVHEDVLNSFVKFCETQPYSQYEILSKFIEDGIDKHS